MLSSSQISVWAKRPWGSVEEPDSSRYLACFKKGWFIEYMEQYVILLSNPWRTAWNNLLAVLLLYTATVFPYRLCFLEFAIPQPIDPTTGWLIVQWTVDGFFWLDLIFGFFFSYTDATNKEITDWYKIVTRYLRGYFILNLVACLPSEAINSLVKSVTSASADRNVHKSVRLCRLQRISRLVRLMRLGRLSKLIGFVAENPLFQQMQTLRGVRVSNLFFGLLFFVHLVACGWYLVASLHEDHLETWVARRCVDADGVVSLLSEGPALKWTHSMYFVLTIFTTVGFGDMSALTVGEIIYCCFTMLLGAVVQSIILSEVINIITSADQLVRQVHEQKALIQEFSEHARLQPKMASKLANWASLAHSATRKFDVEGMKEVLMNGALPQRLTKQLPYALYNGLLIKNMFLTVLQGVQLQIPPRLPLLISLAAKMRHYGEREVVYSCHDNTLSLFLVLSGTFVHLAKPAVQFDGPQDLSALLARSQPRSKLLSLGTLESVFMTNGETQSNLLSPYQIFGYHNYFGEAEIFLTEGESTGSRRSVVRCDSAGDILLVHKKDITHLVADFPRSAEVWYHAAARRENHRQQLLANLKMHESVEVLAASIIQEHVRESLQRKRLKPAATFCLAFRDVYNETSGPYNSHAEQVPHYAEKMHRDVIHLRSEVRSHVDKLQSEVTDLKSCMNTMQGNLQAIADALQVSAAKKAVV